MTQKESLDGLNLSAKLKDEFQSELETYERMRGLELGLNEFLQHKLDSVKEEMLVSGSLTA